MAKTDKELTVEIVNTFITSWNARQGASLLRSDDVADIIKTVHDTISQLPEK